jgi:hypothetical protein
VNWCAPRVQRKRTRKPHFPIQISNSQPRHCERSEAIQTFDAARAGLLRGACQRARIRATRWLAKTDATPRSRDATRPRFARISRAFKIERAQGMPDARCTRSFACKKEKTHAHLQGPPKSCRHSLRNGFTVAPCSPWCTGLVSHHRSQDLRLANLTPASGCQDHTAWPYARLLPVSQHSRVHRHLPHVRDVGQRPSHRDRMGLFLEVICLIGNNNIFF